METYDHLPSTRHTDNSIAIPENYNISNFGENRASRNETIRASSDHFPEGLKDNAVSNIWAMQYKLIPEEIPGMYGKDWKITKMNEGSAQPKTYMPYGLTKILNVRQKDIREKAQNFLDSIDSESSSADGDGAEEKNKNRRFFDDANM
jgi:hypothetical protein